MAQAAVLPAQACPHPAPGPRHQEFPLCLGVLRLSETMLVLQVLKENQLQKHSTACLREWIWTSPTGPCPTPWSNPVRGAPAWPPGPAEDLALLLSSQKTNYSGDAHPTPCHPPPNSAAQLGHRDLPNPSPRRTDRRDGVVKTADLESQFSRR